MRFPNAKHSAQATRINSLTCGKDLEQYGHFCATSPWHCRPDSDGTIPHQESRSKFRSRRGRVLRAGTMHLTPEWGLLDTIPVIVSCLSFPPSSLSALVCKHPKSQHQPVVSCLLWKWRSEGRVLYYTFHPLSLSTYSPVQTQ